MSRRLFTGPVIFGEVDAPRRLARSFRYDRNDPDRFTQLLSGHVVSGALPKDEFERIFSKVPRLTVEVLITSEERGVLLALRDLDPCRGMWNLPGGTVRFGERVVDAVRRVAADELGIRVRVGPLAGYIEYPSHYENRLDSPVGLVFRAEPLDEREPKGQWFTVLPENMHEEQMAFLIDHAPVSAAGERR